jgi:hypothetical protein
MPLSQGEEMVRHRNLKTLAAIGVLGALAASAHAQVVATPYVYVTTLDAQSPTYNRPLANGVNAPTTLSGVGTAVSFGLLTFIPDTTGSYTLATSNAVLTPGPGGEAADDTFYVLYEGIFNPATPLTNAIEADDDDGPNAHSLITRNLTAGTSYTLVTTTFGNQQFGTITNTITGPGGATLNLGSAAAPEPGSLALLGLVALPGVALLRRKK